MPNSLVPAADLGLPAHVIAFPSARARAPMFAGALLDKAAWDRSFLAVIVASGFRIVEPVEISDRRIAAAADRLLRAEGL